MLFQIILKKRKQDVFSRNAIEKGKEVRFPHVIALADKGWQQALKDDPHLLAGLNICKGKLTCEAVSQAHDLPFTAATSLLQ